MELNTILLQQSTWSGITIGFIYGLVALGFTLIYNVSRILNIAQGEFVMIGALSIYSFVSVLNIPIWLAIPLALIVSAIIGVIMVKFALEPISKSNILALIIATVAFGEIIKGGAVLIWGSDNYAIPSFIEGAYISIFDANVNIQTFIIIFVSLAIYFGFRWMNKNTNFGISLTAVAGDPYAAQLMGINVKRVIILVVAIGAAMGAIGGILIGPLTSMSYFQGTMLGIKAFIAALIGGLGSYGGALIGGLVLGLFEAYTAGFISSLLKDAFSLILLLVILNFLPNGLVDFKRLFKRSLVRRD
ncbi:branched-chain amino acid ABC transporter permease [Bacillus sp. Marseille-P3661]|uniref:branched-chain amino acid ABC transporter permease n=1 Tax=Bacillus sp. Marseille-P3661 TaxID=1936234 RepID=UPI0015E1A9DB|nr:branched-chain amino acid ABC transporter permease [Bacillus sp. Marseille-P3661]